VCLCFCFSVSFIVFFFADEGDNTGQRCCTHTNKTTKHAIAQTGCYGSDILSLSVCGEVSPFSGIVVAPLVATLFFRVSFRSFFCFVLFPSFFFCPSCVHICPAALYFCSTLFFLFLKVNCVAVAQASSPFSLLLPLYNRYA
jgi:hypothetical protein